jgi:sugar phosphate isomerase/epimerase
MQTAINLYTVRNLDEQTLDILERVAAAGYDGVQFSGGFGDATIGEVADALDDLGLGVTGSHVDVSDLESDPDGVAEQCARVGSDSVVVPYLDADQFETRAAVEATADRLDDIAAAFVDRDLPVHYHNHAHEFTDLDGTTGYDLLGDLSAVDLEVDVGWVETAGHDPVAVLDRYADRVDLVHMKDMTDGDFCEIGDGDVDMAACADTARAADASWLIYEHDDPDDPAESIEAGAAFLQDL